MTCFKFATLNNNGLHSETRIGMLRDFLRSQDIDIVFLQEVTNHALQDLYGYNTYLNVGTDMRGTAFVTKQDLQITNINKLPSDRGITADFGGVKLINIYAPSGTAKKREREQFYSSEITQLFQNIQTNILLGGDFNCLLEPTDTTGHYMPSKALETLTLR